MKNAIKKAASNTADFVSKHRVAIAVTTTAVTTTVVLKKWYETDIARYNEFIDLEGLREKFVKTYEILDENIDV